MKLSTKIGTFYTEVGGGIFPTSQESGMLFCSRKSQVRTTAGETVEFEAQAELPQLKTTHTLVLLQGRPVRQHKTVQDPSVTDYILPFS